MLEAINPGNDVYNFRNNYTKKGNLSLTRNSKNLIFPNIKQTKDQTTATEEILKSSSYYKNNLNINPNLKPQDNIHIIKNKFIFNGINKSQKIQYKDLDNVNLIKNNISNISNINDKYQFININKNNKNTKLFFNRNFKLKSIEKTLIKSNSSVNIINKNQTLTVINIPSNNLQKNTINNLININKGLKRSSSLPKINFNNKNDIKNNNDS